MTCIMDKEVIKYSLVADKYPLCEYYHKLQDYLPKEWSSIFTDSIISAPMSESILCRLY